MGLKLELISCNLQSSSTWLFCFLSC